MNWQYRHTVLLLHFLTWGFIAMDRMLVVFVAPQMVPELGFSFTEFGLVMSALTVTWAVFALFGGHISDRIGRVKVVVPATVFFSLTTWITGLAGNLGQLLAIRALIGVGEGAYWGAGIAHIAEAWPASRRGFALGLHQTGFPIFGTFIGAAFAGYVASIWGWRAVFPVAGVGGIILAFIFWRFIHEPKSFTDRQAAKMAGDGGKKDSGEIGLKHIGELGRYKDVWINLGVICAVMVGYWSAYSFLALYLTQVKGFDIAVAGGVAGITGIFGLLGQWFTGWFSDSLGRKPVLWIVAIGMAVGTYMIITSTSSVVLVIALAIIGYCGYAPFPLCIGAIPTDIAPARLVGTSVGIAMGVSELAGIAGPIIGGMLNDAYGLSASFWLAMVAYLVAGFFTIFMRESAPSRRAALAAEFTAEP